MHSPDFSNALLVQYETPLPDDFDMAGIRARVREKAHAFDELPGMLVKFYAVNDATSAPLNEYSSIYLWSEPSFLSRLFTGDFFENYAAAFARPTPRWALVQQASGDFSQLKQVKSAVRQTIGIPRKTHIGQFVKTWQRRSSDLLFRVIALDPARWELIDFQFATERIVHPPGVNTHMYDISHVSRPRFADNR